MELRHLRYFIAVAEELNFSRAAERLHVSQPPLSRQIRDLEAELKVKLLDRNTQGVRLTRVGRAVLARSRKLVRDAESLRAEAQMFEKEGQEELRIRVQGCPNPGQRGTFGRREIPRSAFTRARASYQRKCREGSGVRT